MNENNIQIEQQSGIEQQSRSTGKADYWHITAT